MTASDTPTQPLTGRDRRRVELVALALALVPFVLLVARFAFVCDDAFISFRYARNLARGLGLVYNLGEAPVEGYSEFLWVLVLGAVHALGGDPLLWSRLLSVASGLALVVLWVRFLARRLALPALALWGASLFLGTLPPLAVWATGGMSTMAFALAVFATFTALHGRAGAANTRAAAAWASLALLLRADGALWVASILGTSWLAGRLVGDRALARASLRAGVVAALVLAAHLAWRYATYGDWIPNTAHVKLGLSLESLERGGAYLMTFLLALPSVALALGIGLAVPWRGRVPLLSVSWVVVLATCGYTVYVGGDFMAYGRFLVPALPFAALLFGAWLGELATHRLRAVALPLSALLASLSLLSAYDLSLASEELRRRFHFRWSDQEFRSEYAQWEKMATKTAERTELGRALREHTRPGESLVATAIGAVGYYSELFIYDQNGLVTREVALLPASQKLRSPGHDKKVPRSYFAKNRPTYTNAFLWPPGRARPEPGRMKVIRLESPPGKGPRYLVLELGAGA